MKIIEPKVEYEKYDGLKIMKKLERAMRQCYLSEGTTTEDSYKRLLGMAISSNHGSVLEHEKITVRITSDIGFSKEITRHRAGTAFSVSSTRYCNFSKGKFENQIQILKPMITGEAYKTWEKAMNQIEENYLEMAKNGAKPDVLRMILPHSTVSQMMMTANIREWRHIFELRCSKNAHPSCRQILIPLLLKFKEDMPELFEDIEYDTEFPKELYAEISCMESEE